MGLQAGPDWQFWQQIQQTALALHRGLREVQNALGRWWWQCYFVGKMYITEDITYIFHDHRYLKVISSKELHWFEAISSCCRSSFSITCVHYIVSALGHFPLCTLISTNSKCFWFCLSSLFLTSTDLLQYFCHLQSMTGFQGSTICLFN